MKFRDVNAVVAGLLRDLAFAQTSEPKMFGYKRAAAAVLSLERPLTELVDATGNLRQNISGVGPASMRVVLEVLATGASPTVELAVTQSGRRADITRRRGLRTNVLSRAEVLRALADPALHGPTLSDHAGDFQMHSEWSDGASTLRQIFEGCLARGYRFSAVTDHSHGLKIAGGMTTEEAAAQHQEIDRLNDEFDGRFRLYKGVEGNIGADGALDLSPEETATFEIVLAAPHSRLRREEDQTERMLRAVNIRGVHILAHPRGRISGSRAGVVADWDAVFAEAARLQVAIEIDGDPARQDVDFGLASRALSAGCLFALDSDAHSVAQLRFAETAVAHARLAGISADRVVNCWPVWRLDEWLRARKG